MSEFNFDAGSGAVTPDFQFGNETVDPETMEKFFDPGFSFTQEFASKTNAQTTSASAAETLAHSFGHFSGFDSPPAASAAPAVTSLPTDPVAQFATSPLKRPAADPTVRMADVAAGRTGGQPVPDSSAVPRRESNATLTAAVTPAPISQSFSSNGTAVASSRRALHSADVSRQTPATSLRPQLGRQSVRAPANQLIINPVAGIQTATGPEAVRLLNGREVRDSADRIMQKLYTQRKEKERLIEQLSKEKQLLSCRLEEYKSQFEQADTERQELQSHLKAKTEALESLLKESDLLKTTQETLRCRIAQVEKDVQKFDECKVLFEKAEAENVRIVKQLVDDFSGRVSVLSDEKKDTSAKCADLQKQLKSANHLVEERDRKLEQSGREHEQIVTQLREEHDAELLSLQETLTSKEEELHAQNFDLQQQVLTLTDDLKSNETKREFLVQKVSQMEACQQELTQLHCELEFQSAQNEELRAKIQQLEQELAESQASHSALDDDVRQMQEQFDETRVQYEDRLYNERKDADDELKKRDGLIAQLKAQVQALDARCHLIESERAAAVTRSHALQDQNNSAIEKCVQLQNQIANLSDELNCSKSRFETRMESLEQEKLDAEQRLTVSSDEVIGLRKEVSDKDSKLQNLIDELTAAQQTVTQLKSQVSGVVELKSEVQRMVKKEKAMDMQLEESKTKIETLTARCNQKDQQIKGLEDEIDELKAQYNQRVVVKPQVTPVLQASPPKRQMGNRRVLQFNDNDETDDCDSVHSSPKRRKPSLPPGKGDKQQETTKPLATKGQDKKAPEKRVAAKKVPERKKAASIRKSEKKQEDMYRSFADASGGDQAYARRKLPFAPSSLTNSQNSGFKEQVDESDLEWF